MFPAMNPSLDKVRLRLTAWYIGVFTVIMALFGITIVGVLNRESETGVERSLERAINQWTMVVLAPERASALGQDTALYERRIFVFDAEAKPLNQNTPEWLEQYAKYTLQDSIFRQRILLDGRVWQLYGKKFRARIQGTRSGFRTYATVAVADVVDIRDRYPTMFTGLVASAVIAVLLVGIGGAALARQSTRPIENAFDQMRRFMSDAAHELKTPVAVLRARADVALQRTRTSTEYEEILSGISAETQRLGILVENMMLLARADAGQWPVVRDKVFLDDVLMDAVSAAQALGAEKGVEVCIETLDETAVRGDPGLLRQLFMIVLDNAVHFTPAGGRITASAWRDGRYCRVTICDTGTGIPASALPHVFDRFFRADPARGRSGAGLGLSIASWIADTHHARIEIKSTENVGTTVTMTFSAV